MAGKTERKTDAETIKDLVDQVKTLTDERDNAVANTADWPAIFAAVSTVAAEVAPELELAPVDADEPRQEHIERLLGEIATVAIILVSERDDLKRSLTAQKGATTRIKGTVDAMKEAAKPRKLGPLAVKDGDEPLSAADMLELVQSADQVEIAFSDGKQEIAGFAPRIVSGDAWRARRGRLVLEVADFTVHGPAVGTAPYPLAAYALLVDGEQIAFQRRSDPLQVGAGQSYSLKGDVAF